MKKQLTRGLIALAAAAVMVSGCSSSLTVSTTTSTTPRTSTSRPGTTELVVLPTIGFKSEVGSNRFIVAGRGRGDKSLGRFRVTSANFVIQTVCKGKEPLELVGLEIEGPCVNAPGVLTTQPDHAGWFIFKVKAPPATEWAVYVTQAR